MYFKWFKLEELVDLTEIKILWPLKEFVEVVDIAAHLKEKQAYDMLPLSKQNVYVLLICKTDSARIPEIDYFYDHLPALFLGIYKRNKETWLVYNAGRDEFPSDEVMKYAKGTFCYLNGREKKCLISISIDHSRKSSISSQR